MKSTGLKRGLPPGMISALAHLVRSMNCYYSNLIEGHDTHPIDIERALKGDYSNDPQKRNLQLEANAHIAVQSWIDEDGLANRALTTEGIREVHKRFYDLLPKELSQAKNPQTQENITVIPGGFRTYDVQVGRLIPISPGSIPRFLDRFESVYSHLGKTDSIITAATAHHRLLYIHPFLGGNGRVARLMSYAILHQTLDTKGLWSIARGLARQESVYKQHLAACDQTRRNDLDGRGHLSEENLAEFAIFFLKTCIDQVAFMEKLMQPEKLQFRIIRWAEEETKSGNIPQHSSNILEAILYRGSIERSDLAKILGITSRHARRITSSLLEKGVLTSPTPRSPLELAFPAELASIWMPGLFPEK